MHIDESVQSIKQKDPRVFFSFRNRILITILIQKSFSKWRIWTSLV